MALSTTTISNFIEPRNHKAILPIPHLFNAMKEEIQALNQNKT